MKSDIRGRSMAATIDAIEARLVMIKRVIAVVKHAKPKRGLIPITAPREVAAPLPPRNPKIIGQVWPQIAAIP